MKLSPHFTLEEMTFSQTAKRRGIGNVPPQYVIDRIVTVAEKMERVRIICGDRPITVTSGYRSPLLNKTIGSKPTSAHPEGYAVDFRVNGLSVKEIISLIEDSAIKFDQLINEYGSWVHISFDPRNRRQVFTIGV